jgi:hypothetical protein
VPNFTPAQLTTYSIGGSPIISGALSARSGMMFSQLGSSWLAYRYSLLNTADWLEYIGPNCVWCGSYRSSTTASYPM